MSYSELFSQLLKGALVTMQVFAYSFPCALVLGILITLAVVSKIKPLQWVFNAYIYLFRGTPLLLQILMLFYGVYYIPFVGPYLVINDRMVACIVAFTINYSAYFAEIFRGGLLAVEKGQYEGAKVLGLTKTQTMFKIVFPQMIRVALPSLANETITLVKDTSLIFAVGIHELLENSTKLVNAYATFNPYIFCAIFYLVLTTVPAIIFKKLEKKFTF